MDHQDAMKNTNEWNKKSTEDMKNYKIMDRESQKEALKGNLALKYRIRCIKHIYLGSY